MVLKHLYENAGQHIRRMLRSADAASFLKACAFHL
jgi:hypothetical protein